MILSVLLKLQNNSMFTCIKHSISQDNNIVFIKNWGSPYKLYVRMYVDSQGNLNLQTSILWANRKPEGGAFFPQEHHGAFYTNRTFCGAVRHRRELYIIDNRLRGDLDISRPCSSNAKTIKLNCKNFTHQTCPGWLNTFELMWLLCS